MINELETTLVLLSKQKKQHSSHSQHAKIRVQESGVLKQFLKTVYEYFDLKHIVPKERSRETLDFNLKVISVMRVFTPNQYQMFIKEKSDIL